MTSPRRPAETSALMTGSVWAAYDKVNMGGTFEFAKPLPGWRVDRVYADGTIADYKNDRTRTGRRLRPTPRFVPLDPAIEHRTDCLCGYRIMRDVYVLLQYVLLAEKSAPGVNFRAGISSPSESLVLTRTLGFGLAENSKDPTDPTDDTIRVSKTQIAEVFLPRDYLGNPVPDGLAQKIRRKYGVTVRRIPGSLYDFQGSPDTVAPDRWAHTIQDLADQMDRLAWTRPNDPMEEN